MLKTGRWTRKLTHLDTDIKAEDVRIVRTRIYFFTT